jgi:hypothetical protein
MELLKKRERILRLTPDLLRIEIRHLENPPLYKVDSFFKVDALTGVTYSNRTRHFLLKLTNPSTPLSPQGKDALLNSLTSTRRDKQLNIDS